MFDALDDYIADHISPEPPILLETRRHTFLTRLYPNMCSGHVQGRVLKMLTELIAPRRVLELGTFTGYSTLCIAEGMPSGGELHTVEIDDEYEDELRELFSSAEAVPRIHLHIGDALEIVPRMPGDWDMVLIDANKRFYGKYLEMIVPRVRIGGYILADNTLWAEKVINPHSAREPQTRGIMEFNDMVAADERLEKCILPLRDGLTLIKRLK